MTLIVPTDSRKPVMGCIDHKERTIVVFENGTLGYTERSDDADLRGGSKYVSIISDPNEITTAPQYSPSEIDWNRMKKIYISMLALIYSSILFLIIAPFFLSMPLHRGTWNDVISDWTGIDFSGPARIGLAFIAAMLAFTPEISVGGILSKRANMEILNLNCIHGNTEIMTIKGEMTSEGLIKWWSAAKMLGPFPLPLIVVLKVAFMALLFHDYGLSVLLLFITPIILIVPIIYISFRNRKSLSEDKTVIPKVGLDEIHKYIIERWKSTKLETIISLGEGLKIEFKSSLWFDYDKAFQSEIPKNKHRYDPNYDPTDKVAKNERSHSVIKAVTGFLNSDVPGTLLIGVSDNGEALGLERDFELLSVQPSKQRDEFEMQLDSLLTKHLSSMANLRGLWNFHWLEDKESGKLVCMLEVEKSPEAVYLKKGDKEIYYRRTPSKTEPIPSGIELQKELKRFPR